MIEENRFCGVKKDTEEGYVKIGLIAWYELLIINCFSIYKYL